MEYFYDYIEEINLKLSTEILTQNKLFETFSSSTNASHTPLKEELAALLERLPPDKLNQLAQILLKGAQFDENQLLHLFTNDSNPNNHDIAETFGDFFLPMKSRF